MQERTSAKPFGEIALCLSGGGFRAAGYALGTLKLLYEARLLDDVTCISTISGGTFTGAAYALSVAGEMKFNDFSKHFSKFLISANAVDEAFRRIYDSPSPSGSKDLSLIRAAAGYYESSLFTGKTFGEMLDLVRTKKKFRELIFNATEFRGGNGFRFRASRREGVFIGNQIFSIPQEIAGEMRVADIVAASSCFPGAFEPLRFPDDFFWQSSNEQIRDWLCRDIVNPADEEKSVYPNGFNDNGKCLPLPLMDGGIFDNQGLTAAVLADSKDQFGTYLITDTSPRNEAFYEPPAPSKKQGGLKLSNWLMLGRVCAAICLLSVLAIAAAAVFPGWAVGVSVGLRAAIAVIAVLPATALLFGAYKLFSQIRKYSVIEIAGEKFEIWNYIKHLRTRDAIDLIAARLKTVLVMTSSVFMKRIRQLQFNNIMDAEPRPQKVVFNLIHSLDRTSERREEIWKYYPVLQPGAHLRELARKAEGVETKLWVDDKQLEALIECGRATTCFSLMKFIWTRWLTSLKATPKGTLPPPRPDDQTSPDYEIHQRLLGLWLEIDPEAETRLRAFSRGKRPLTEPTSTIANPIGEAITGLIKESEND